MKQIVKLRVKKLANGQGSYYLDWCQNGKRNYEYLKLYIDLTPNPSREVKKQNEDVEQLAQTIRNQRENELIKSPWGIKKINRYEMFTERLVTLGCRCYDQKKVCELFQKCFGGDVPLVEMDREKILTFYKYLVDYGYSQTTIKGFWDRVKSTIKSGVFDGSVNPDCMRDFPKVKRPVPVVTYLTAEEITRLKNVEWPNAESKRGFLFAIYSGLRYCDVRKLKWENITSDNFLVFNQQKTQIDAATGKAYAITRLPLNRQAIEIIGERKQPQDLVFKLKYNDEVNRHIQAAAKKAGIEKRVHFHMARHTLGVQLLCNGVEIYTVSKLLGHKSIQTTQRFYSNITEDKALDAINKLPEF